MKCPKCGFVSYAGLEQCKKCGYPFVKAALKGGDTKAATLFLDSPRAAGTKPAPPETEPRIAASPARKEEPAAIEPPPKLRPKVAPPAEKKFLPIELAIGGETPTTWREELSERVEKYRKRHSRGQAEDESEENLELDFENPAGPAKSRPRAGAIEQFNQPETFSESGKTASENARGNREPLFLDNGSDHTLQLGDPTLSDEEEEETPFDPPQPRSVPVEILVGQPAETIPATPDDEPGIYLAPVPRRCVAGLIDTLVLLLGDGVFGVIFWRFCGRMSLTPLNMAVLGLVAVIMIFAYFAVFTAIASSTPGLLWMGCEVRNLRGEYASPRESLWRAFGILVSLSAMTLGFIWATVDSNGLTWHDHMSGTAITLMPGTAMMAEARSHG